MTNAAYVTFGSNGCMLAICIGSASTIALACFLFSFITYGSNEKSNMLAIYCYEYVEPPELISELSMFTVVIQGLECWVWMGRGVCAVIMLYNV